MSVSNINETLMQCLSLDLSEREKALINFKPEFGKSFSRNISTLGPFTYVFLFKYAVGVIMTLNVNPVDRIRDYLDREYQNA